MRRFSILLLAATLIVGACGDDGGGGTDPAAAGSCEELADVGINVLQEVLDELDKMELAEIMAAEEMPPAFVRLEELDQQMEARAEVLGCDEEEGVELMCDRIDRLDADGEVSQFFLAEIAAECG
jgi:hypothetical protein